MENRRRVADPEAVVHTCPVPCHGLFEPCMAVRHFLDNHLCDCLCPQGLLFEARKLTTQVLFENAAASRNLSALLACLE